jgi:hypothetical protein
LSTNIASLQRAFDRWKDASKTRELVKGVRSNKLGDKLLSLYLGRLKGGFRAVKSTWEEYSQIKSDLINRLILACQSEAHRSFNVWRLHTRHIKRIESCNKTLGLFAVLNDYTKSNLQVVLELDRVCTEKKKDLIKRFISVYSGKLYQAFHRWHEYAIRNLEKENQKNQQIKQGLDKAVQSLRYSAQNQIRDAFLKLKDNVKVSMFKKRMIKALIKSKQGILQDAFNRWRNRIFQFNTAHKQKARGIGGLQLEKIYQRALRKGFDRLKQEWSSTNEIKRHFVRRWVAVSKGKYGEKFEQWKAVTRLFRDLSRAGHAIKIANIANDALRLNLEALLQKDTRQDKMIRIFK